MDIKNGLYTMIFIKKDPLLNGHFKLILQSYLFMLLLHATGKLSLKRSAMISTLFLFLILLFNIIGALFYVQSYDEKSFIYCLPVYHNG
ncbi:hypothetical protein CD148_09025 [Staphylococcus delphini]|uniref:Uncharacterized protein n=1 Tax=Staphylococcus delphini TaxID=53344 RepID=A0AAX0QXN1_9STAP|nr:hypothetical protein B5C07_02120 [Staphylococcus delphini]PNZ92437.1 hypothetical protein CD148_09025 [Staphylococcus delphini]RIZ54386.1 hypothetical protein CDL68_04975 [Staphylococcus delphini]VED63198.1 Uncharacterised protein [Staphylococcus delphini]